MSTDLQQANSETRAAWDANAAYWDAKMGDTGNDFVNQLIWPAAQRLLNLQPGERVLDVGCGNGLYARRLAALGSEVVAFDFAQGMIEQARRYPNPAGNNIVYHVLDATDEQALLSLDEGQLGEGKLGEGKLGEGKLGEGQLGEGQLGEGKFDAALSCMVLMDMAEIEPLFRALARLLRPRGRFVFAVSHPAFNQAKATHMAEMEDTGSDLVTTYAVKVRGYMTPSITSGMALAGQPQPQLYFDRPLQVLLGAAFAAGFVVDALEERAFAPDNSPGRNPLGWSGKFSEIPPVLMVRLRLGT